MSYNKVNDIILADTWWYGLTQRMTEDYFQTLAEIRFRQGFSTIQLVVGIPPEVGPKNENAKSKVGFPWTIEGFINEEYLDFARQKIQYLNNLGLNVIIYGAWGYQINWTGYDFMRRWWSKLIDKFDDLDVLYCLTGEIDLLIDHEFDLLPDKSSGDIWRNKLPAKYLRYIKNSIPIIKNYKILPQYSSNKVNARKKLWSNILSEIFKLTNRPILVHPTRTNGFTTVANPDLLTFDTIQSGHGLDALTRLWQMPLTITKKNPNIDFINLEPCYEGINNRFYKISQLNAFWITMLLGAVGYCYGAHGIWNVGDGKFLSHWGKQTFKTAIKLDTPNLIGRTFKEIKNKGIIKNSSIVNHRRNKLISIKTKLQDGYVYYYPDVKLIKKIPKGKHWDVLSANYTHKIFKGGPLAIFSNKDV